SKGQGGPGSGGGLGSGIGPGKGGGIGPGEEGRVAKTIKRKARWVMNFSTYDGRDYAKQLEDLGAIVAAPLPEAGKYTLIRNLARPGKKEVTDDLNALQRIWWTDDNPRSVRELCSALEIRQAPPALIAFFPRELEEHMADMEADYAKKHGNRNPDEDIAETVFQVKRRGAKYQPEIAQRKFN